VFLVGGLLSAAVVIGVLAAVGWVLSIADSAPSIDTLKPINQGASSEIIAADGKRLGFIQSDVLRTPITLHSIPQALQDATVAIEDQRFFQHGGIDLEGIVRAAFADVTTGRTVQGGSTITQQLVRNLYLGDSKRNLTRKIHEMKLAQDLEHRHPGRDGKLWILEQYLNTIPYGTVGGQTAIGVQAAARIFFDKSVSRLNLPQSALVAGLPQAPSEYNPFLNPQGALLRRNDVLAKMAQQHYITLAQAQEAEAAPLGVHPSRYYTAHRETYFFDYVKQQLIDQYGINQVRQGGLKVYTTLDLGLQQAARAAIAHNLNQHGDPSSAIVSIDPRNGYIRAMASSSRYGQSEFNLAAQGHRQPGSTFKIMVLMTAVREGIDPYTTTYNSHPLHFTDPKYGPINVQTYSHTYLGTVNLVKATLASDNTVYQQLDLDVGPDAVRHTAYQMGITTHLNGYPAEGLGGLRIGVSPLEMANAYATIASGGWRNKPIAITRVLFPDGHTDDLGRPHRVKEFSSGVTSTVTKILEQNIQQGTAVGANISCPAAAKTGTVDNFTDAWLVGYTPHMSTSVWVGYPNAKVPMTSVHGISVAGGTIPASIWHDYMQVAQGQNCANFNLTSTSGLSPFFSSHSNTGNAGAGGNLGRGGNSVDNAGRRHRGGGGGAGGGGTGGGGTGAGGGGGGGGGGRHGYNPNFYESPPQAPPSAPLHGGGGGGGGGGHHSHGGGGAAPGAGGGTGAGGGGAGTPGGGGGTGGGGGSTGGGGGGGAQGTGGAGAGNGH
jgi:penicillin-binding protein 1A